MTPFPLSDLLDLFVHFLGLSLLSIGGAMTAAPEMHRYLVNERQWLNDTDFTASIALAQAAPGPNVLFIPVLGFQAAGLWGAAAALIGIILPSSLLSLTVSRWGARRRDNKGVRAFTSGFAPITVGLVFSTTWLLAFPYLREPGHRLGAIVLIILTAMVTLKTRLSPIWLILPGAIAGAAGWI